MYVYRKVIKKIKKTLDIAVYEIEGQCPSIDFILNLKKVMECINNQSSE